ncbi:hypothetical protein ACG83_39540 [Frankia sp. R43]|uniref:hypothetical protein n=1 Tax=Frankia sp. R43 TaxID=269536 RepID=UPI0006CA2DEF|nr:hypothetical protein [Frankia sp. R43]KPM50629.1 hypothetical protein ACG83_39540 [Frankia sp. R43]
MSVSADPVVVRVLSVVLCATVSVIAGLAVGILARVDGASLAGAALTGCGAFSVALGLALAVAGVLARGL